MRCTHQPSPWIGDWGWFLFTPQIGTYALVLTTLLNIWRFIIVMLQRLLRCFALQIYESTYVTAFFDFMLILSRALICGRFVITVNCIY
jgi:hypothetical protein